MSAMASQIIGASIVYSTVYSGTDQRKQSSTSLAFVRGIHWWPLNSPYKCTGGIARWLQLQSLSSWPRRRKRSKMFSLCTTRITCRVLIGCIPILDFHFKIVLVLRRRYLILTRCKNGKEKCGLDDGCTILNVSTNDGCTRWWRWLHQFRWVILDTHTADSQETNMHIGCIDGLVQDCSNSSTLAMELLQSSTKPSVWLLSSLTRVTSFALRHCG